MDASRFETGTELDPGDPDSEDWAPVGSEQPSRIILIVDDEPDILFVLEVILRSAGYRVIEANHGASALEVLSELVPDLIITDLMMPVMDGHELIARVREDPVTTSIPVIVLTAYPGVAAHAETTMKKPFLAKDLLDVVGRAFPASVHPATGTG